MIHLLIKLHKSTNSVEIESIRYMMTRIADDRDLLREEEEEEFDEDEEYAGNQQHIQQMVHHLYNATDHHSESYIQELIQNSADGLDEEAVTEIRAEVKQQMDTKVEMIIRNISRQPNTPADDEFKQLVSSENAEAMEQYFITLTEPNMDENEALERVNQMSQEIVQLPKLTAEIEQLVSLLIYLGCESGDCSAA